MCDLFVCSLCHRAVFSAAIFDVCVCVCVCFTGTAPLLTFPVLYPSEAQGGNNGLVLMRSCPIFLHPLGSHLHPRSFPWKGCVCVCVCECVCARACVIEIRNEREKESSCLPSNYCVQFSLEKKVRGHNVEMLPSADDKVVCVCVCVCVFGRVGGSSVYLSIQHPPPFPPTPSQTPPYLLLSPLATAGGGRQ